MEEKSPGAHSTFSLQTVSHVDGIPDRKVNDRGLLILKYAKHVPTAHPRRDTVDSNGFKWIQNILYPPSERHDNAHSLVTAGKVRAQKGTLSSLSNCGKLEIRITVSIPDQHFCFLLW